MPLMEISIVPVGGETPSFSETVKEACRVVEQNGLSYQVTPTATVVEGEIDQLMAVSSDIHRSTLQNGIRRVVTQITIDDRLDGPMELGTQVDKVKKQ
ncbi:uncharacterized protein (TIGR00106 family) [Melghirimyces profundicolus]|uniref:Uncharacterized protein (TIGR00106 family) n=1 Tax=Melghirimyces profundicolus TaxID=1242148 RepID=A0A2T6BSM8_9BACL|nr:MTH1187 family thiamine-binding protein [Melghirimyces profundicolus]PTX59098.1 uncharacterized protein (TIGR00106 family) [Melghirimyces profundicolus]